MTYPKIHLQNIAKFGCSLFACVFKYTHKKGISQLNSENRKISEKTYKKLFQKNRLENLDRKTDNCNQIQASTPRENMNLFLVFRNVNTKNIKFYEKIMRHALKMEGEQKIERNFHQFS